MTNHLENTLIVAISIAMFWGFYLLLAFRTGGFGQ